MQIQVNLISKTCSMGRIRKENLNEEKTLFSVLKYMHTRLPLHPSPPSASHSREPCHTFSGTLPHPHPLTPVTLSHVRLTPTLRQAIHQWLPRTPPFLSPAPMHEPIIGQASPLTQSRIHTLRFVPLSFIRSHPPLPPSLPLTFTCTLLSHTSQLYASSFSHFLFSGPPAVSLTMPLAHSMSRGFGK